MRQITSRQLHRTLNRHYPGGPWIQARHEEINGQETWVFMNTAGRMVGIRDTGPCLYLNDSSNPNDTMDNPSLKLSKGKKIRPL